MEPLVNLYTVEDIKKLKYTEILPFVHIIIDGGGRCMCGIYGDKPMSCQQILKIVVDNRNCI